MKFVFSQLLLCIGMLMLLGLIELDHWYEVNYRWKNDISKNVNIAYPFSSPNNQKYYELFRSLK